MEIKLIRKINHTYFTCLLPPLIAKKAAWSSSLSRSISKSSSRFSSALVVLVLRDSLFSFDPLFFYGNQDYFKWLRGISSFSFLSLYFLKSSISVLNAFFIFENFLIPFVIRSWISCLFTKCSANIFHFISLFSLKDNHRIVAYIATSDAVILLCFFWSGFLDIGGLDDPPNKIDEFSLHLGNPALCFK